MIEIERCKICNAPIISNSMFECCAVCQWIRFKKRSWRDFFTELYHKWYFALRYGFLIYWIGVITGLILALIGGVHPK